MLRQTLGRWLERKAGRPIISRGGRAAKTAPAAASTSAAYTAGDDDDLAEVEELDLMADIPIEPLGRPASATMAATAPSPSARTARAHELLTRLDDKYLLSSRSDGTARAGGGEPRTAAAPSARRVMSTPRRPHTASTTPSSGGEDSLRRPLRTSAAAAAAQASRPPLTQDGDDAETAEETEGADDAAETAGEAEAEEGQSSSAVEHDSEGDATQPHATSLKSSALGDAAATATSADAYRFLLNHIDAEIAALQRRHSSVTTRRQSVQSRQTQRIKELFEVIEAPWTLLPTEEQPALPATGVDVYIKEQQLARQRRQGSGSSGSGSGGPSSPSPSPSLPPAPGTAAAVHEGPDKMYVLALHKNYKSMPAGRKRFYEEAAHYNAAVREEMKYQLTRGCARFEAFLDRVKECTMEMAREGQVPPLPSGHAQRRAAGYHAERWRSAAGGDGEAAAEKEGRRTPQRQKTASTGSSNEKAAASGAETAASTDSETAAPQSGRGGAKGKGKVASAAKKVKAAAAKSGKAKTKGEGSAKASKVSRPVSKAASRGKASAAKKSSTPKAKKSAVKKPAASGGGAHATSSRSIPLPDLNKLALKKIKQITAPLDSKKKAPKKKAAAGKKKKK